MVSNWQLKLDRAREHHATFLTALRQFQNDDPVRIVAALEGNDLVLRARDLKPIPPVLSLIAGDVLHNARAALDHLIMSLAERGAGSLGRAPAENEGKDLYFPVTRSEADFAKKEPRLRKYLCGDVIDRIAADQPFAEADVFRDRRTKSGDPASDEEIDVVLNLNLLSRLHALNNRDKHRRILLTQWWPGSVREGSGTFDDVIDDDDNEMAAATGQPASIDPELLARLRAAADSADARADAYDFFFDDGPISEGSEIGRYMRHDHGPMPTDITVSGQLRVVLDEQGLTGVLRGAPRAERTIAEMLDEVASICQWVELGTEDPAQA